MSKYLVLSLALLMCGCAVARVPKRAYQELYCNEMEPDGRHCAVWATPCGKIECR